MIAVQKSNLKKKVLFDTAFFLKDKKSRLGAGDLIKNSSVHYICTYNAINTLHLAVCTN